MKKLFISCPMKDRTEAQIRGTMMQMHNIAEAIDTVRQGMRQVMTDGTASRYFKNVTAYTAAGKTGTAQTGIDGRSDHGVFIGYAPYDNPEVAIAVVLENGTSRPSTRLAKTMLDAYFASKDAGVAPTPEGELLP